MLHFLFTTDIPTADETTTPTFADDTAILGFHHNFIKISSTNTTKLIKLSIGLAKTLENEGKW